VGRVDDDAPVRAGPEQHLSRLFSKVRSLWILARRGFGDQEAVGTLARQNWLGVFYSAADDFVPESGLEPSAGGGNLRERRMEGRRRGGGRG